MRRKNEAAHTADATRACRSRLSLRRLILSGKTCYYDAMDIPKQARRWYLVMVFCVLLSFFAFAVGPTIGYSMEAIQHVGLMIAVWAPTLGILGVRAELLQRREQDRMKNG